MQLTNNLKEDKDVVQAAIETHGPENFVSAGEKMRGDEKVIFVALSKANLFKAKPGHELPPMGTVAVHANSSRKSVAEGTGRIYFGSCGE